MRVAAVAVAVSARFAFRRRCGRRRRRCRRARRALHRRVAVARRPCAAPARRCEAVTVAVPPRPAVGVLARRAALRRSRRSRSGGGVAGQIRRQVRRRVVTVADPLVPALPARERVIRAATHGLGVRLRRVAVKQRHDRERGCEREECEQCRGEPSGWSRRTIGALWGHRGRCSIGLAVLVCDGPVIVRIAGVGSLGMCHYRRLLRRTQCRAQPEALMSQPRRPAIRHAPGGSWREAALAAA